jgi:hypothetical protein
LDGNAAFFPADVSRIGVLCPTSIRERGSELAIHRMGTAFLLSPTQVVEAFVGAELGHPRFFGIEVKSQVKLLDRSSDRPAQIVPLQLRGYQLGYRSGEWGYKGAYKGLKQLQIRARSAQTYNYLGPL